MLHKLTHTFVMVSFWYDQKSATYIRKYWFCDEDFSYVPEVLQLETEGRVMYRTV